MATLSTLQTGNKAVISQIHSADDVRQRMHAMGIRAGREAQIIRRGRLGGPIQVRIGSVSFIMRQKDAEQVEVSLSA